MMMMADYFSFSHSSSFIAPVTGPCFKSGSKGLCGVHPGKLAVSSYYHFFSAHRKFYSLNSSHRGLEGAS